MESAMTAGSGPSGTNLLPVYSSHGVPCIDGADSTSRPVSHAAPVAVTALRGEGAVSGAADRRGFGTGQMPGALSNG